MTEPNIATEQVAVTEGHYCLTCASYQCSHAHSTYTCSVHPLTVPRDGSRCAWGWTCKSTPIRGAEVER